MSRELETNMKTHRIKSYWGGNSKGRCVQITGEAPEGYIQLTMVEAAKLINTLAGFVKEEAMRRQALLKKQISDLKITERTIFHEVSELSESLFTEQSISVDMVNRFAPFVELVHEDGEQ
jgi:hypothetical protein